MSARTWKLACTAASLIAIVTAGVALTGCGSTRTVPGPVITRTVDVPGPVVTKTVQVPGPVVTVTAQPPVLLTKSYNGSGNWNSSQFTLGCDSPVVTVTYSYSGNSDISGPSNFMADISSAGGDDQIIANDIAASGGKTTTLYPDTSGGNTYYLAVTAQGSWSFRLSATC